MTVTRWIESVNADSLILELTWSIETAAATGTTSFIAAYGKKTGTKEGVEMGVGARVAVVGGVNPGIDKDTGPVQGTAAEIGAKQDAEVEAAPGAAHPGPLQALLRRPHVADNLAVVGQLMVIRYLFHAFFF